MGKNKMPAYEGKEKYIFVSYSHKDSKEVYPILEALSAKGFRIWYDEGIIPGSEWPENIAQHLNESFVTMAFISPNAIASPNCRREITYALSKNKEFVGIILSPTEMSPGIEMQLSSQQSVLKYNYESEEKFLEKLLSMPSLSECMDLKQSGSAEPEKEETTPENTKITSEKNHYSKNQKTHLSLKAEKIPFKKDNTTDGKSKKPGRKTIISIIAAVAALAVIVTFAVIKSNYIWITTPDNEKITIEKDSFSVDFSGKTVTQDMIDALGKMDDLCELRLVDCIIEGDLSKLPNIDNICYLYINNADLSNFNFLEKMTSLETLEAENCGFDDSAASCLSSDTELYNLDLAGNEELTDISPIPVNSLEIFIIDNTSVKSIDNLADAENLTEISIANTKVSEINGTFKCIYLEKLDVSGITDTVNSYAYLNAFKNVTRLETLDISDSDINNVSWLSKNAKTLKHLYAERSSDMFLSVFSDFITQVASCIAITDINLSEFNLTDLSVVANMADLEIAKFSSCGLEDASALSDKTKLKEVWLDNNNLTSLDLTATTEIESINAAHNKITDFSTLFNTKNTVLPNVIIFGNPADIDTLPEKAGKTLAVSYQDNLLSINIPDYSSIIVTDVPDDKLADFRDAFGAKLYNYTSEELDRKITAGGSLCYYDWT